MQASHNPTPSPTCDQRVASSRRPGVAGTAVATKLRALDFHCTVWSLWEVYACNEFQKQCPLTCHSDCLLELLHVSCWLCRNCCSSSFAHIYTYCIAHSCFLSSCSNAMLMLDPLAPIQRLGPPKAVRKLLLTWCYRTA